MRTLKRHWAKFTWREEELDIARAQKLYDDKSSYADEAADCVVGCFISWNHQSRGDRYKVGCSLHNEVIILLKQLDCIHGDPFTDTFGSNSRENSRQVYTFRKEFCTSFKGRRKEKKRCRRSTDAHTRALSSAEIAIKKAVGRMWIVKHF